MLFNAYLSMFRHFVIFRETVPDLFTKHGDIDSGGARKWKVYRTIRQTTFTKDILLLMVVFRSTWALLVSRRELRVAPRIGSG